MGFEARADDFFDSASPADDGSILLARKQQRDHADALADTGSPFASLGCFRTRPPLRRKPVLVVSDEELAEAHQAFETGAASLVEVEEPVEHRHVDFLGLSGMGADDDPGENMGADVTDDLDTGEDLEAIAALSAQDEAGADDDMPLATERPVPKKSMALPPVSDEERQADVPAIEALDSDRPSADRIAPESAASTPAPPATPPARTMQHLMRGSSGEQGADAPRETSAVASLFERMRQQSDAPPAPRAPAVPEIADHEEMAFEPLPEPDEPPSILEQMARMRALPEPGGIEMPEGAPVPEDAGERSPARPADLPGSDDRAAEPAPCISAEELLAEETVARGEDAVPPLDPVEPGFGELSPPHEAPAAPTPAAERYEAPVEQELRSEPRNSLRARFIREDTQPVEIIPEPQGLLARLWSWIGGRR